MSNVIQKIIFGSPGTGKSHLIKADIIPNELEIDEQINPENVIKAVFHPEYTYGDFMGKLLPITKSGQVEYHFYEGHFLKALSHAYRNLLSVLDKNGQQTKKPENVVLVIDEINRGNSSAIFGSVFQLLDRDDDGWSSYDVTISGVMFDKFLELIGYGITTSTKSGKEKTSYELGSFNGDTLSKLQKEISPFLKLDLVQRNIKIPPNLHIVATMNTSDSSIYHMDTAFKRRWEWQFIDVDSKLIKENGIAFKTEKEWIVFIEKLNQFIKSNHSFIRGVEDKQIGKYFIRSENSQISYAVIQSKLMFFIWDSVFNRDKKPLIELLEIDKSELVTFGDFALKVKEFIKAIQEN